MLIVRSGLLLVVWAICLGGCLRLQSLELGHAICGPWGCGPPASALLAMQLFWLVALVPMAIGLVRCLPQNDWRVVGLGLSMIAVLAIIGVGVYDYFTFQQNFVQPQYVWQRFLFRIATLSDFPLVQLGIAGIAMTVFEKHGIILSPQMVESKSVDPN